MAFSIRENPIQCTYIEMLSFTQRITYYWHNGSHTTIYNNIVGDGGEGGNHLLCHIWSITQILKRQSQEKWLARSCLLLMWIVLLALDFQLPWQSKRSWDISFSYKDKVDMTSWQFLKRRGNTCWNINIFFIYKDIYKRSVAKSYMTNGLFKSLHICLNIWAFPRILGSRSHLNFLTYEENFLFFFIGAPWTLQRKWIWYMQKFTKTRVGDIQKVTKYGVWNFEKLTRKTKMAHPGSYST